MARRRMLSSDIILTDEFLDMSLTAQALYMHLNMQADDDGFVSNPRTIIRMIGGANDDMKILMSKKFLLSMDNKVCVVKHWRINNYIRKDIYKKTKYTELKERLKIRPNGAYTLTVDNRAVDVPKGHFQVEKLNYPDDVDVTCTERPPSIGKVRLGKVSIDKDSKGKKREVFKRPTLEELKFTFKEKGFEHLAETFHNHYESNGWKVGRNSMKSWKATVAQWVAREKPPKKKTELSDKYSKYGKN